MILNKEVDAKIFALATSQRPPTVVCDGWTEPRHPRIVLKFGSLQVSNGMCEACQREMEKEL